jgi:hypothetical protein
MSPYPQWGERILPLQACTCRLRSRLRFRRSSVLNITGSGVQRRSWRSLVICTSRDPWSALRNISWQMSCAIETYRVESYLGNGWYYCPSLNPCIECK